VAINLVAVGVDLAAKIVKLRNQINNKHKEKEVLRNDRSELIDLRSISMKNSFIRSRFSGSDGEPSRYLEETRQRILRG